MQIYYYDVYGLQISSEIELVGLGRTTETSFDVEVSVGSVPASIESEEVGIRFQVNRSQALYTVDNVARYFVENGKHIVIDPVPGADPAAIGLFCLEAVVPTLLAQREQLVLRGSAIAVRGHAIAFLGEPGTGKSTIAAGMTHKGYPILSDGICALRADRPGVWSVEAGPALRLWPKEAKQLGFADDALSKVRHALEKRWVRTLRPSDAKPLPVKRVYFIHPTFSENIEIETMDSRAAFNLLQTSRVGAALAYHECGRATYLQLCLAFAQHPSFARVTRPRRGKGLMEIIDQLEHDFPA